MLDFEKSTICFTIGIRKPNANILKIETKTLLIAGGVLLALPLVKKAFAGAKLNIVFSRVKNIGYQGGQLKVTIELRALNPTGEVFTINSLLGNLFFNSASIGQGFILSPLTIQPNSYTDLPITFTVDPGQAANAIYDIATNGKPGAALQFKGSANVDGVPLPINQTFNL